ncbi:MAG: hypothetical protein HYT63_03035 [Candidatus Yanofskybacteria bacterium]|nr:hypothetical protein [Candidatus Yanofskybacteria bacterium]
MNTIPLHYKVIYKNGDRLDIADFRRTVSGNFIFEYKENPKYLFPGFSPNQKKYESNVLWEQIAFRVPNSIRNQFPSVPLEELLAKTSGRLVTDHFEFILTTETDTQV